MRSQDLHVETYGTPSGRPLLAIHGITGFGARFERLAGLVDRPRWICPDLRGHGRSPTTPPWRTEDHVADLLTTLDAFDVDEVDVVGHSFGGHLALHLLALAPERVGRLVLLDPATLLDPADAETGALGYARDPGWATEDEARAEIATWFPNEGAQPDLAPEIDRNLVQDDDGRWRMGFSPVVVVAACSEMCRPLPALPKRDVLLVEADPAETTVNPALRSALEQAFGSRLRREVVAGATHMLFRTELEGTARPMRPFLTV